MRILAIALCAAPLALAGCDQGPEKANTEELRQQILAQEDAWAKAYAARDADAVAGFFAEDSALAAPGSQLLRGQDDIRKAANDMVSDENLNLSFRANRVEVSESGDLAYSRGQYLLTMTNPQTKQPESSRGYYLTVWKKQADGSWKAIEDFTTTGPPLPVTQRATMIQ